MTGKIGDNRRTHRAHARISTAVARWLSSAQERSLCLWLLGWVTHQHSDYQSNYAILIFGYSVHSNCRDRYRIWFVYVGPGCGHQMAARITSRHTHIQIRGLKPRWTHAHRTPVLTWRLLMLAITQPKTRLSKCVWWSFSAKC